jgi:ligand-binding sensor domain-containing protein
MPSDNLSAALRLSSAGGDRLLVGTRAGLFIADNASGSSSGTVRVDRAIRALAGDQTVVWLATDQGLYRYLVVAGTAMRVASGSGTNAGWTSLALGAGASVWLGGTSGVARYSPGPDAWQTWKMSDGLISNQVNSLAVEQQTVDGMARDIVWIATSAGVSRLDALSGGFQSFTTADGLPSNAVTKVVILADGSKLFATDAGVARYTGR